MEHNLILKIRTVCTCNIRCVAIILMINCFLVAHHLHAQTYAKNGMVASDNMLASEVGVEILKKGGNAVDASIATAFALAVTHPQAGNIGGGGFMVFRNSGGMVTTIDFREKAPLKASSDMFLDENGVLIPGSNHNGLKSVGVPGTVAGLFMAHEKYGSLPWADLVQPAIDLAQEGFDLTFTLAQHAKRFASDEKSTPFMKQFFNDSNGELLGFGDTWKQPVLAQTLKAIRDNGHDGFYKGEVAKKLVKHMKKNGGIITQKDLDKYEAIERSPIKGTYKRYDVYGMPPPSSGGVAMIEMLNLLEHAGIDTIEFNSTKYVHLVAEAMRRAFADRAEHLGDPDFNPEIPIDKLLSKDFAKLRLENIDMTKASKSDSSKFGQLYDGQSTTHFSVADKDGNTVSLTYTLEYSYGARDGSAELGFIYNNEMGDFNPQSGYTNSGWLIGSDPNIIQPEKRMLSSMCPTIVSKEGKPYLIIGSPGGRTIINTVFQAVLNVLAYDMRIDKAIEAMKIHHQWLPDYLVYEENLMSPDTRKALEKMGHKTFPRERLGRLMGIVYDAENDVFIGASDSSSPDGGVAGY